VLFLDAVKLRLDDVGREWLVPVLTLGPGTLLIIGVVALAAWLLFQLPPVSALLIGAVLASTDPVVLRDVTRDERIPHSVRRALSIESGMNDIIVLPIILVLIAIAQSQTSSAQGWLQFLGEVLLLGPVAGFAIGGVGAWLMNQMSKRVSIRREYEALYGVGLVLASYVVGEAIGGSGFLAAFFAGLAVAVLNVELCSCFLEYGEVTAEMAMLVAFVLFGAVLSTSLTSLALAPALLLAIIVVIIARPLLINFVLLKANISRTARAFIGWFGPRGLSSLLFALLVVHAGVKDAEQLFAITGVVVLVSVIIHGISATPLSAWYGGKWRVKPFLKNGRAQSPGSSSRLQTNRRALAPRSSQNGSLDLTRQLCSMCAAVPIMQVSQRRSLGAFASWRMKSPTGLRISRGRGPSSPIAPERMKQRAPVWRDNCARWASKQQP